MMNSQESPNLDRFKRRAFELCSAIYRVTKLFPAGEVLISQLRETSSQIVVLLAQGQICDTILKVEELKIYLALAKEQNWLKPVNFDLMISAYSLLADALYEYIEGSESVKVASEQVSPKRSDAAPLSATKKELTGGQILSELDQRQKMIIDYLERNKEVRVAELVRILGGVSERTVRNDLASLIEKNLVKKVGSRKDARYLLI